MSSGRPGASPEQGLGTQDEPPRFSPGQQHPWAPAASGLRASPAEGHTLSKGQLAFEL